MTKTTNFKSLASRGLAYWRLIEAFSPQGLPKIRMSGLPYVATWKQKQLAPWDPTSQFAQRASADLNVKKKGEPLQHTVFAALYDVSRLLKVLGDFFPSDKTVFQDRSDTQSAICKFLIDDTGAPIVGSFVLSSAVWSVGCLLKANNPSLVETVAWVDQFDEAHKEFKEKFDNWAGSWLSTNRDSEDSARRPDSLAVIGRFEIDQMLRGLISDLGCSPLVTFQATPDVPVLDCLTSTSKKPKSAEMSSAEVFMNSFFLADIEKVRSACISNPIGPALKAYLAPDPGPAEDRCDVRKPSWLPHLLDLLSPARFPAGAWPGKDKHPLVFSQQIAVNEIYQRLFDSAGLFSVNGPPGTGKTTLLRDVIAMVIVERARLIADGIPFFTGQPIKAWDRGGDKAYVAPVNTRFYGFEMVVASSNNGAVENVTLEIPGLEAIDSSWLGGEDNPHYFSDLASAILSALKTESSDDSADKEPFATWAVLAAPLGNSKNRNNFVRHFWDQKRRSGSSKVKAEDQGAQIESFQTLLMGAGVFPDFSSTLKRFKSSLELEELIRKKLMAVHAANANLPLATKEVAQAETALTSAKAEAAIVSDGSHPRLEPLSRALGCAESRLVETSAARVVAADRYENAARMAALSAEQAFSQRARTSAHLDDAPWLWLRVLTFGYAGRRWRRIKRRLEAAENRARIKSKVDKEIAATLRLDMDLAVETAMASLQERDDACRALKKFREGIARQVTSAETGYVRAAQRLKDLRDSLNDFQHSHPDHYPDHVVLIQDENTRERSALWLTREWYEARCQVFLAAVALHKAYIGANRASFLSNLSAIIDVLKGGVPPDAEMKDAVANAWRTLFFVVPVVSTTFASFDRLFAHLGQEALGWLMIDEAGQAAPQAAVGALWRSRRAVIVGDPLQLEPIVQSPYAFQKAVQRSKAFELDDTWIPGLTSVQRRADSTMNLGTTLVSNRNSAEQLWVGAPLRVHRRCDDPMFSIANSIAYENMMVFGKKQSAKPYSVAGIKTGWIDVPFAPVGDSNCNPREIETAEQVLLKLQRSGSVNLASDVFLLAPFQDTASKLKELGKKYGISPKRTGTIHTAQGKEADIVILSLGGNTVNARKWAASAPNLLNVAVTRAKRMLVVIGSRANWSSLEYFNTASDNIETLVLYDISPIHLQKI